VAKKNFKNQRRGDTWRFCAMFCSQGGITENLQYARGESQKKKILQGGITKHPYFAGGKSYLTLFLKEDVNTRPLSVSHSATILCKIFY
jgi:hypothetical protein